MKYFAYGSNMNPQRLRDRGIRFDINQRMAALLQDYELRCNKKSLYYPGYGGANINKNPGSIVEGIIYEISDEDIEKLDVFEGYPESYTRIVVTLQTRTGAMVQAVTYIAVPEKIQEGLKPHPEYFEHILRGAEMLSSEYRAKLKTMNPRALEITNST